MKKFLKVSLTYIIQITIKIQNVVRGGFAGIGNNRRPVKNFLVYTSMGIGDFLLFTPTLKAIKKSIPDAEITLLVNCDSSCKAVIDEDPLVGNVMFWDRKNSLSEKIRFFREIRKRKFDCLINSFWADDIYIVLTCMICYIPLRIGFCSSREWKSRYSFLYNRKIDFGAQHEVYRGLEVIRALGMETTGFDKSLWLYLKDKDRCLAEKVFAEHGLGDSDLIIGIHPGSSPHQSWKRWNIEKYVELIERLIKSYNAKIIIFGSKDEISFAEFIKERINSNIIDITGKTKAKEAAAFVEKCDFFVGNDSGLMHVCSAMNTPVIAIYGPTDPHKTAPFDNCTIVRKDLPCSPCFNLQVGAADPEKCSNGYECLNSISVDEIFENCNKIIEKIKQGNNTRK